MNILEIGYFNEMYKKKINLLRWSILLNFQKVFHFPALIVYDREI